MHVPAFKLGLLAVKQVSKYMANYIKAKAKSNPIFRNYICMPPAQFYNYVEVTMKMWALKLGKPVHVPPLTEAAAIELGSELVGEFVLFSVGAGVLIFEYTRSKMSDKRKTEKLRTENAKIQNEILEMEQLLQIQEIYIEEMSKALSSLGHPVKVKPVEKDMELMDKTMDSKGKPIDPKVSRKTVGVEKTVHKKNKYAQPPMK